MLINELMKNDLVMFQGNVYRVNDIYGTTELVDISPYFIKNKKGEYLLPICKHVSLVEPIPLTSDILKNEGWKKGKYDSVYSKEGVPFMIDIGRLEFYINNNDDCVMSIESVNQLQHLYKLFSLFDMDKNINISTI